MSLLQGGLDDNKSYGSGTYIMTKYCQCDEGMSGSVESEDWDCFQTDPKEVWLRLLIHPLRMRAN